jgi:hypothetical protein
MGKMKELATQIDELLENGYDIYDIALILEIDLKMVQDYAQRHGYNETTTNNDYS